MEIKCKYCQGPIDPNMEKIGLALGGGALVSVIAIAFGLSGSWIVLLGAYWGGSMVARWLLQAKVELMRKSNEMGSYFKCSRCGKDASIEHVFSQIMKKR